MVFINTKNLPAGTHNHEAEGKYILHTNIFIQAVYICQIKQKNISVKYFTDTAY